MLVTASALFADANTARLSDPKPVCGRLHADEGQSAPQDEKRVLDALSLRSKYPDAAMTRWRIQPDIGEVQIQGDEDPVLGLANSKDSRVGTADKALGMDGMRVVARGKQ